MSASVQSHGLSVDVEDYFQVLNLKDEIDRGRWDEMELRCAGSTERLLTLFERHGARATFFFLGWIAERLPALVRQVASMGHEIGSHGYDHRLLGELGPEGFKEDLRKSIGILGDILGERPRFYRACTWSVTKETAWALPILAEEGFRLDSSIQPVRHPDYGVPGARTSPYRIQAGEAELLEFPPLSLGLLGRRLPVGGGGYLRLFPLKLVSMGLKQQERLGWPGCIYVHPWELDPEQPRFRLGGLRGFRHYVNLHKTEGKLERLLSEFRFVGLQEALDPLHDRLQGEPVRAPL